MVLLPTMKTSFACFASSTLNLRWLMVFMKSRTSSPPAACACMYGRACTWLHLTPRGRVKRQRVPESCKIPNVWMLLSLYCLLSMHRNSNTIATSPACSQVKRSNQCLGHHAKDGDCVLCSHHSAAGVVLVILIAKVSPLISGLRESSDQGSTRRCRDS